MEREPMRPVSERQQQILDEAVSRYEWDLLGSEAAEYLESRGLTDATVAGARLGVVRNPAAGHSKYEGMLCIPYLDQQGRPLTMRFRCLRDHDCRQHNHGKYLTLPGDQPRLYNVQALTGVKPGTAVSVSEGECFPDGTQVLTPRGWVDFADLTEDDQVGQWEDGSIEFVKPLAYIEKDYDGELIEFSGKGYVSVTTPGHRVPFFLRGGKGKRHGFHSAETVAEWKSRDAQIPRAGRHDGPGTGLSEHELRLMLAISADLSVRRPGQARREDGTGEAWRYRAPFVTGTFTKVRKLAALADTLNALGIEYTYSRTKDDSQGSICFFLPDRYDWMGRMLPMDLIARMTADEKEFILREMVEWDGNSVPNRNQVDYSSKYIENVTWMQTVAHMSGRVSSIMRRSNAYGSWYKASILHGKNSSGWQGKTATRIPYRGKVRCVKVPSGAIMVRYKECVTMSGNCDALILGQCGYPAIALAGANSWRYHYGQVLEGFNRVLVWADGDDAGAEMAGRIRKALPATAEVVAVPKGEDVNSIFLKYGKDGIDGLARGDRLEGRG